MGIATLTSKDQMGLEPAGRRGPLTVDASAAPEIEGMGLLS